MPTEVTCAPVGEPLPGDWLPPAGQFCGALVGELAARETFVRLVLDRAQRRCGAEDVWLCSLETQQRFYEDQLKQDDTDFLDHVDPGTPCLELLLEAGAGEVETRAVAREVGLESVLERGYRLLSTGESRLVLLVQSLLRAERSPGSLVVVVDPFEGLDANWRGQVERLLPLAAARGVRILVVVPRLADVPAGLHALVVAPPGQTPRLWAGLDPGRADETRQLLGLLLPELRGAQRAPALPLPLLPPGPRPDPLLRLSKGAVRYERASQDPVTQFEGLDWTVRPGQHTLVTGPNGSGKSTLLGLISGDHPQCYSNELWVLGYRRGHGESIWDVKQHLGLVSPALHRDYRARCDVLSVVLSGLYDSIGLYREPPARAVHLAQAWLDLMGMAGEARRRFDRLAWGQQRLVLIARALIKHPPLVILDEPTQGLDELGRLLVLAFLEQLARLEHTTLLMVTHRPDERLTLFRQHVQFRPSARPGVRFEVTVETR